MSQPSYGCGPRWRALGIVACSVVVALVGCDADGDSLTAGGTGQPGAAAQGLYLGTEVQFRVSDGVAYDFRFSHIECRVPHPDNAEVALCLTRPAGRPADTLTVKGGGALDGMVGDLLIEGLVDGASANGTWHYEAVCFDGSTCEAHGPWTATWTAEPGGSQPRNPLGQDDPRSPIGDETGEPSGSTTDPEGGTDEPTLPGRPADGATELQLTAWEAFEAVRLAVGIEMPGQDDALNAAAQAHADYYALHADAYAESGLNPHDENPDWPEGYSGTGIGDRLTYHGATGGFGWGEVMAFTGTAQGAVDGWMATLYHRIPFVHPNTLAWGFGISQGGTYCEVMDYSIGPPVAQGASSWAEDGQLGVPWPPPGMTGVDSSWNGAESPQPPLPAGESYPSGPVITLTFVSGSDLALTSASLHGPSGEVPVQVQTPDNDPWLSSTWSLYAFDPLQGQTTYTVHVVGSVNSEPYEAEWSFVTR